MSNYKASTTYPTNLMEGRFNPLRRTSYKKLININSRFRDNYTTTPASDFYCSFPESIDNVVSMSLHTIILPTFIHTVNYKTGSDNFTIYVKYNKKVINKRVCIQSGSYNATQMINILNKELKQVLPPELHDLIEVCYAPTTGKIYFEITWEKSTPTTVTIHEIKFYFDYIEPCQATSKSDCSGVPCSSFLSNCCNNNGDNTSNFCQNDEIYSRVGNNVYKDQLTLGWLLGFRGHYKYNTSKVAAPNPTIDKFFTGNLNNPQGLSRKQLRELNTIRPRRARLTEIKDNGMQYLENTYNCCDPSGRMFEPQDISFCYTLLNDTKTKVTHFAGESIYDALGNRYFLFSVNDFQNHCHRNIISPMQKDSLTDGNILAKLHCGCGGHCHAGEERLYFGPTNISRLNIRLLDEVGRIVDLNNGDYSFTLEVEILYDL